ncbi:MAG: ABC transporter permease [Lutibacter sp.]
MNAFLHIAKREVRILFSYKTNFIFTIILPFVSMLFFNTLLQEGVPRDLPIAVVDFDQSALSRNLIFLLDATPELKVTYAPLTQKEGEALVRTGDIYGLVTIPNHFEKDLKQGKQTKVINQFNGNLLLPGGLEDKAFKQVVGTLSAGVNIQKQLKNGVLMKQAKANFQPVSANNHVLSNPFTNYSYYLNSGFLTMFFQIFVILTTVYSFGSDFKYHKGKKLYNISKGNTFVILMGKVLPYTLWFFFLGLLMYFSMFILQDFPLFGNKFAILAGLLLLIISSQSFAVFFISISNSLRQALTLGSGFGAVSLAFSGITFPILGMPAPMQWLSQIFPFTHFLELFLDQTQRGIPVFYSFYTIAALILLSILPMLAGWSKLKKLLLRGEFLHRI